VSTPPSKMCVYYLNGACAAETAMRLGGWMVGWVLGWVGGGLDALDTYKSNIAELSLAHSFQPVPACRR
jgi:hypothetical protein